MTDRDRLIDIFKKIEYTPFPEMTIKANLGTQFTEYALNTIVDELLANGVIVPPCKVGQTVYYAEPHHFDYAFCGTILSYSLDAAHLWFNCHYDNGLNMWHSIEDFGKTVFFTKEEAEAKLKRGSKNEL